MASARSLVWVMCSNRVHMHRRNVWRRSPYKSIRLHDYQSKTLHGAWTSHRTAYQPVN